MEHGMQRDINLPPGTILYGVSNAPEVYIEPSETSARKCF